MDFPRSADLRIIQLFLLILYDLYVFSYFSNLSDYITRIKEDKILRQIFSGSLNISVKLDDIGPAETKCNVDSLSDSI